MQYPNFLKITKTISTVAPSFCIDGKYYETKYKKAISNLKKYHLLVKEGNHIHLGDLNNLLLSPSFETKANDFMEAYLDKETKAVWSVAGGELMTLDLDYIDFNKLAKSTPKWFIGFSDNTTLGFLLPTLCDIATIYTYNITSMGTDTLDSSQENIINFLCGNPIEQHSFTHCEGEHVQNVDEPTKNIEYTVKTCWKSLNDKKANMEGRIIGGCLDILINLAGTKYDNVKKFAKKYKKDGIILFMEACDLNILSQLRAYKQLENCGWFDNINGIIIGRPLHKEEAFDVNYEQILHLAFDHLGIPVIYDFDVGHTAPVITIINGSYVEVSLEKEKGLFKTVLK